MKCIGLIGGMSWESTATYYRLLNQGVKAKLGGHHSAKLILHSLDFAEIEQLQRSGKWEEAGRQLADSARTLQNAGADFIVLCTNTMHNVAAAIEDAVSIPLLHIVDPTAAAIKAAGIRSIALLGTRFTMEQDFYVGRLRERHGLDVLLPNQEERDRIHRVIYEELVHGKISADSRRIYLNVVERLQREGAQGVILGCTEIAMLIGPTDLSIPCFDTTALHAAGAVESCLRAPF
jgi:aspartate racemase